MRAYSTQAIPSATEKKALLRTRNKDHRNNHFLLLLVLLLCIHYTRILNLTKHSALSLQKQRKNEEKEGVEVRGKTAPDNGNLRIFSYP